MDKAIERRWNLCHWLVFAVVAYVLSFMLLIVDVKLFNAKPVEWLGVKERTILIVYYPILELLDYFFD